MTKNEAADGAYGAVDPRWLAERLAADGPWWYHVTPRTNASGLAHEGLTPADARNESRYSGSMTLRPGHVYLGKQDAVEYYIENLQDENGKIPDLAAFAIDLRQVAAARLVPDEDTLWTGMVVAAHFGLSDPNAEVRGLLTSRRGARFGSFGEWAEAVRLGAQPGIVEQGYGTGKLAVRGAISPSLLVPCETDDFGVPLPPQRS